MAVEELARAPGLPALYGKAIYGSAAGTVARWTAGRVGRPSGTTLPDTELLLRGVTVDRAKLAEYARVCGFTVTDTLPVTYPHVLAFPLALALMTTPGFPLPAAGLVHVANRIVAHRPLDAAAALDLSVRAERLRAHPRGQQVDLVTVASVGGAEVWREVSTYLHRSRSAEARPGGSAPAGAPAVADRPAAVDEPRPPAGSDTGEAASDQPRGEPPEPTAVWRVDASVGSAYAAVSGDHNPIHTSRLAARAFGFRRRIAHGMWTKARCLAHLAPKLPAAYTVEVRFHAPVLLPATVGFSATPDQDAWRFALHSVPSGRPHLAGTVAWPPA